MSCVMCPATSSRTAGCAYTVCPACVRQLPIPAPWRSTQPKSFIELALCCYMLCAPAACLVASPAGKLLATPCAMTAGTGHCATSCAATASPLDACSAQVPALPKKPRKCCCRLCGRPPAQPKRTHTHPPIMQTMLPCALPPQHAPRAQRHGSGLEKIAPAHQDACVLR